MAERAFSVAEWEAAGGEGDDRKGRKVWRFGGNNMAKTIIMFAKFANINISYYFCCTFETNMEITFEKDYLRQLFYEGKAKDKQHLYQPHIIKKYVQIVNIMDSVDTTTDLLRYRSLHYEKLIGEKAGLESVRVNDQYRIEFRTSTDGQITLCNITELSNHYK